MRARGAAGRGDFSNSRALPEDLAASAETQAARADESDLRTAADENRRAGESDSRTGTDENPPAGESNSPTATDDGNESGEICICGRKNKKARSQHLKSIRHARVVRTKRLVCGCGDARDSCIRKRKGKERDKVLELKSDAELLTHVQKSPNPERVQVCDDEQETWVCKNCHGWIVRNAGNTNSSETESTRRGHGNTSGDNGKWAPQPPPMSTSQSSPAHNSPDELLDDRQNKRRRTERDTDK